MTLSHTTQPGERTFKKSTLKFKVFQKRALRVLLITVEFYPGAIMPLRCQLTLLGILTIFVSLLNIQIIQNKTNQL